MRFWFTAIAAISFCATFVCAAAVPTSDQIEFFETKIRPVLASECYQCHSTAAPKLKGKLRLDSREGILKGGESDLPAVVPGKIDDGQLLKAIRQEDEGLSMPPKKKLPGNVIADFEAWVKMGAPMPAPSSGVVASATTIPAATSHPVAMTLAEGRTFWSFVRPKDSPVPKLDAPSEIDRFLLEKLAAKKLSFSPSWTSAR